MRKLILVIAASLICSTALAQQQAVRPAAQTNYGVSINNEQAKEVAIGAVAEAKKNNWNMSIAVVGTCALITAPACLRPGLPPGAHLAGDDRNRGLRNGLRLIVVKVP